MIEFKWLAVILTTIVSIWFIYLTGKGEDEEQSIRAPRANRRECKCVLCDYNGAGRGFRDDRAVKRRNKQALSRYITQI